MDALVTGPGGAQEKKPDRKEVEAVAEPFRGHPPCKLTSVTAVVNLVIMLKTVIASKTSATTVEKLATSPKIVWSLNARESSTVTPAVDRVIWLAIAPISKSRNATLAVNLDTSRRNAPKSSATDVERPDTWLSTVKRQSKSTVIGAASLDI